MEQHIQENIEERIALGHKIYGTYRFWKAAAGDTKRDAWKDYITLRKTYTQLMDAFDSEGRIPDHRFSLERHQRNFFVCRYWPGGHDSRNGDGNRNGNEHEGQGNGKCKR